MSGRNRFIIVIQMTLLIVSYLRNSGEFLWVLAMVFSFWMGYLVSDTEETEEAEEIEEVEKEE